MPKKNLLQSTLGFTLIELLISIVIVVILSSIGIASFNSANARNGVQQRAAEIRSLARKLRTDAGAAVKPVTGIATATSCKTPVTTPPIPLDAGTVYGTYISFANGSSYTYGVACFDSGGDWLGSTTTASLPTGFTFTTATITILFPFNGLATSTTNVSPSILPTDFANPTLASPQEVKITDGSNSYYVYFNGNGLICEQRNAPPSTCAQ